MPAAAVTTPAPVVTITTTEYAELNGLDDPETWNDLEIGSSTVLSYTFDPTDDITF